MATILPPATAGARQFAGQLTAQLPGLRQDVSRLNLGALQTLQGKRDRLLKMLEELRQRRDLKKAQRGGGGTGGAAALGGGALGLGVGALLAAPTGGLSLLAGAGLGGAIGGLAGSAVDLATGGQPAAAVQPFNQAAGLGLQALERDNPYGPSGGGFPPLGLTDAFPGGTGGVPIPTLGPAATPGAVFPSPRPLLGQF